MDATDRAKRAAGIEAARMAESGWVIGLGTGTTAAYAIAELGRRMRDEGAVYYGVPTSHSSEILARRQKIQIRTLYDVERIDLAIDGADEVDRARNLLKGSGGAHTREKIVDAFAELFVVIVDDSKLVSSLGHRVAIPLEVLSIAVPSVTRDINKLGGSAELRVATARQGHYGPIITDQGNMILDVKFPVIDNPKELECRLNSIPGVLENGIFAGLAHLVLVGSTSDGTVSLFE
jgi:ribose 5-phosphate isomerase A